MGALVTNICRFTWRNQFLLVTQPNPDKLVSLSVRPSVPYGCVCVALILWLMQQLHKRNSNVTLITSVLKKVSYPPRCSSSPRAASDYYVFLSCPAFFFCWTDSDVRQTDIFFQSIFSVFYVFMYGGFKAIHRQNWNIPWDIKNIPSKCILASVVVSVWKRIFRPLLSLRYLNLAGMDLNWARTNLRKKEKNFLSHFDENH